MVADSGRFQFSTDDHVSLSAFTHWSNGEAFMLSCKTAQPTYFRSSLCTRWPLTSSCFHDVQVASSKLSQVLKKQVLISGGNQKKQKLETLKLPFMFV